MVGILNSQMPTHKGCCICFEFIPVEDLWKDVDGTKWDMCEPCGAYEEVCQSLKARGWTAPETFKLLRDLTRYYRPDSM